MTVGSGLDDFIPMNPANVSTRIRLASVSLKWPILTHSNNVPTCISVEAVCMRVSSGNASHNIFGSVSPPDSAVLVGFRFRELLVL